jgi:hypothetical protein
LAVVVFVRVFVFRTVIRVVFRSVGVVLIGVPGWIFVFRAGRLVIGSVQRIIEIQGTGLLKRQASFGVV